MVGTRIGNYRVVREIGAGAMGAVFEAVHEAIGKRVAIKILRAESAAGARESQAQERFAQEARALTSIQHPGIVQIFDFGQLDDGSPYMAMELLQGESLAERLRRGGPLPLQAALRLGRQLASALAEAHLRGVVHRDLKPEHVIVVPDPEAQGGERARVLDFGIAKVFSESAAEGGRGASGAGPSPGRPSTRRGLLLGTPAYASPEQCRGAGTVDDRSDVYSLGCILFELLTGRPPFCAEGEGEIVAMHLHSAPPRLRDLDPAAPAEVEAYLDRLLAKLPAERPSMAHVAEELLFLGSKGSGALLAFAAPAAPIVPLSAAPSGAQALRAAPLLPPSSTSHGAGERVAYLPEGPAKGEGPPPRWSRPPPLLWVAAAMLVIAPAAVLLKRRLETPTAVPLIEEGEALRAATATARSSTLPPRPEVSATALPARPGEAPSGPRGTGEAPEHDRGRIVGPARGPEGARDDGGAAHAAAHSGSSGGDGTQRGAEARAANAAEPPHAPARAPGGAAPGDGRGAVAAAPPRGPGVNDGHGAAAQPRGVGEGPGAAAQARAPGPSNTAVAPPYPGAAPAPANAVGASRPGAAVPAAGAGAPRPGAPAAAPGAVSPRPAVAAGPAARAPAADASAALIASRGAAPPAPASAPGAAVDDRPRNLPAAVIRKDKIDGAMPGLSAVLRSHLRGTGPLLLSYKICVGRDGRVGSVQPLGSGHAADESVIPTLRTWTYRPKPFPVCFIETFNFVID